MQSDIERILIDRQAIADRVQEVARQIIEDLSPSGDAAASLRTDEKAGQGDSRTKSPGDVDLRRGDISRGGGEGGGGTEPHELTLIPVLTGSFIFVADLIRHLPLYMQIRLISVSSYPGTATSSRGAKLRAELSDLPESLEGAHVLVIDDILDSGNTLAMVTDLLAQRKPARLATCVLLRKRRPEAMRFPVDYVCFDIPDEFVVGYGLDYNDYYRNLPDIVTLRPQVISAVPGTHPVAAARGERSGDDHGGASTGTKRAAHRADEGEVRRDA